MTEQQRLEHLERELAKLKGDQVGLLDREDRLHEVIKGLTDLVEKQGHKQHEFMVRQHGLNKKIIKCLDCLGHVVFEEDQSLLGRILKKIRGKHDDSKSLYTSARGLAEDDLRG